jgi:hypothetical protein
MHRGSGGVTKSAANGPVVRAYLLSMYLRCHCREILRCSGALRPQPSRKLHRAIIEEPPMYISKPDRHKNSDRHSDGKAPIMTASPCNSLICYVVPNRPRDSMVDDIEGKGNIAKTPREWGHEWSL